MIKMHLMVESNVASRRPLVSAVIVIVNLLVGVWVSLNWNDPFVGEALALLLSFMLMDLILDLHFLHSQRPQRSRKIITALVVIFLLGFLFLPFLEFLNPNIDGGEVGVRIATYYIGAKMLWTFAALWLVRKE